MVFRFFAAKVFCIVYTTDVVGIMGDLYETFDKNEIWGQGGIGTG